jgi:HSP90 family molecular chaperone
LQPQSRFWEQPAGTKVRLTLKRGAEEFQTEITLRDLIGPAVKQRDETAK